MIAETMSTEYVLPGDPVWQETSNDPHQVQAVTAVRMLPSSSLSEALTSSAAAVPVKSPQPDLACDKRLAGGRIGFSMQ